VSPVHNDDCSIIEGQFAAPDHYQAASTAFQDEALLVDGHAAERRQLAEQ
jgi:hypothetical protein